MTTLLGHTLGTPQLPLKDALELFARSGLDGAEIIWQDGYLSAIPESDDGTVLRDVQRWTEDLGLIVGCLTPYVTDINSLDESVRRLSIDRLRRSMETASALGAHRIRVYGGAFATDEHREHRTAHWEQLITSLRELGEFGAQHDVVLCVENHFSTMTESVAETVAAIREVDSPNVGILYDQANLTFTHCEDAPEAVALQEGLIRHVHVKDLEFIDPDRRLRTSSVSHIQDEDRVHRSRMIGDGVLDWADILTRLDGVGYDGLYSLEYEYRWNPADLPEPAIGFPESTRRFRAAVEAARRP
jgi:sugar phosphate isomerase/epimerase